MTLPRVHAITDERILAQPDLEERAKALAGGGAALHARGHWLTGRAHFQAARLFTSVAPHATLVNDRVDIALALPELGIVLGETSLPLSSVRRLVGEARLVGRSVHDPSGASRALDDGANFVIFGPIFTTPSHAGHPGHGLNPLAAIVGLGLPVIAIGGITIDNAAAVRDAGAAGVAAIRALWDADNPGQAARDLQELFSADLQR